MPNAPQAARNSGNTTFARDIVAASRKLLTIAVTTIADWPQIEIIHAVRRTNLVSIRLQVATSPCSSHRPHPTILLDITCTLSAMAARLLISEKNNKRASAMPTSFA